MTDAAISARATELALRGDVLSGKLPDTLQVGAIAQAIPNAIDLLVYNYNVETWFEK